MITFWACLIACSSSAQKWSTVSIDSVVSVQLPKGYEKTDTTNQIQLLALTGLGTIMILKSDDNPKEIPDIEKDRHLEKYYKKYIKSISKSSGSGNIMNEKSALLGALEVKDFTLQVDSGSGKQYRDFRIMHANGATYVFQFLYDYLQEELVKPEKLKFFNSIKVNETIERQDQYTSLNTKKSNAIKPGWLIGGGAILLAIILFIILKRRRT